MSISAIWKRQFDSICVIGDGTSVLDTVAIPAPSTYYSIPQPGLLCWISQLKTIFRADKFTCIDAIAPDVAGWPTPSIHSFTGACRVTPMKRETKNFS